MDFFGARDNLYLQENLMAFQGVVITGTSGSGKSTIARKLCETDDRFQIVRAVTTRTKREDDLPGTYEYISSADFSKYQSNKQFLITAEYRDQQYAIRHSDYEAIVRARKIPVLTITPESLKRLSATTNIPPNSRHPQFLSFFVDAPDSLLDRRLSERGSSHLTPVIMDHREIDRKHKADCHYVIENHDLNTSVSLLTWLWDNSHNGGILSDRIIRLMFGCRMLLDNVRDENISGASYDLSLGDEYFYGGSIHQLSDRDPILLIEPYDYAIVTSDESSNLPNDVCARFDLSVSLFCQGIILSNGPQIDPGFKGPLFCLLFNTSSSPVLLKRRQHYATLEFHKMMEPTYSYRGQYQAKSLLHYLPSNAARGAINELKKELEQVRKESQQLQNTTWAILALILALVAVWLTLK
jgi:deoxycytidine triphosphate deaminase